MSSFSFNYNFVHLFQREFLKMDLYNKQTRGYRYLVPGYFLLVPVVLIWIVWAVCLLSFHSAEERVISFYEYVPHYILNVDVNILMIAFIAIALAFGVLEKKRQHVKWYKTPGSIRILITISAMLLFLNIFQVIF